LQGNPQIAVGYTRVSTDEQKLGPEAQRSAIAAWAARETIQVSRYCDDENVSGSVDPRLRPGFNAAMAAVTELKAGVIVVARRDRLARDAYLAAL